MKLNIKQAKALTWEILNEVFFYILNKQFLDKNYTKGMNKTNFYASWSLHHTFHSMLSSSW
jgi:hypothetical protein